MPRNMSPAMLAAIQASILYPAIFVNMGFSSGTVYVWSGVGNVTWNGNTYTGVGSFGGVSVIEEGATVDARGITLTLSGIDPTMLADALQNLQLGLPITIYLALYNSRGGSIIADPLTVWNGAMDQPEIVVSGPTATIQIKCESLFMQMNVPVDARYCISDPHVVPGDLGFLMVPTLQERALLWGAVVSAQQNI